MTRQGKPREWCIPLGVLAPTGEQSRWDAAHLEDRGPDCMWTKNERQRMAVCDAAGLVAVTNSRYVDVYHLDQLRASASPNDNEASHKGQPSIHLPLATQIMIADHVSGFAGDGNDDDVPLVATCVHFAAPGVLLVAVAHAIDDGRSPLSWICGFRLYSRSVGRSVASLSSLIVHCAFVDPVPDSLSIASVHMLASGSTERGVVLLLFRMSPQLGVFQWKERFSDRSFSVASVPSFSSINLTAIASTPDGRWAGLCGEDGIVFLLDFRGVMCESENSSRSSCRVREGRRMELGSTTRLGRIDQRGQNGFESVRLTAYTLLGGKKDAYGTCVRWWVPEIPGRKLNAAYLLAGQNDGTLTVMALTKAKGEPENGTALKILETYPAIRSLKDDSIIGISTPQYLSTKLCFVFSTVTRTSWREWEIKIQQSSEEKSHCKVLWPTLTESLGLSSLMFAHGPIIHLAEHNKSNSIDTQLTKELIPLAFESKNEPSWDVMLTSSSIMVIGHSFEGVFLSNEVGNEENTLRIANAQQPTEAYLDRVLEDKKKTEEPSCQNPDASSAVAPKEPSFMSIRDRYKLPPMPSTSNFEESNLGQARSPDRDGQYRERLTKDEYNKRLASMAQRVERLSTTMHTLRHSFQLFSEDVQRHFMFISDQLEQLQDTSEANPI